MKAASTLKRPAAAAGRSRHPMGAARSREGLGRAAGGRREGENAPALEGRGSCPRPDQALAAAKRAATASKSTQLHHAFRYSGRRFS